MHRSLAHRIRWGNVLRLAAAIAVVALVVAWPRLASPAPRVEGDEPVAVEGHKPVAVEDEPGRRLERRLRLGGEAGPGRTATRSVRRAARRRTRPARPALRRPARLGGARRTRPAMPTVTPRRPAVAPPPAVARVRAPPASPSDPAALEFGPEG